MMNDTLFFESTTAFKTESGALLPGLCIAYHFFGNPEDRSRKLIWICHALTANANPMEWWPGLTGKGKLFDPEKYNIICANILGSCYGTTGPLDIDPQSNKAWFRRFPILTVRDLVHAHILLADHLQINHIDLLVGGSVGSHQAMEWAIMQAERIRNLAIIGGSAVSSPWLKAFSASQRMAIEADPTFFEDRPDAAMRGLEAARSIALLSYRNATAYNNTQFVENEDPFICSKVESYQRYQGIKLRKRFNVFSYYIMTKCLDAHDVGRGRGGVENALRLIRAKTLVLSIRSDLLFSVDEHIRMANAIVNSHLQIIESDYGHDGFLLETETISKTFRSKFPFLD